jgi:hypothetical protein
VTEALATDTGVSPTDRITSNPAASGGGDANATVTISEGGTPLGTTIANGSGAWSFTPSLGDGVHTLVATETNANGTGTASLAFTLDTTAPAVVITSTGGPTNQPTQTIAGTVSDTNLAANPAITLFDNGSKIGTTTASGGAWSTSITLSGDGGHAITAQASDLAGNTGTSNSDGLTLKTTGPLVTIALVADTGVSATDRITSNPAVTGTADPNATVTLSENGTILGSSTATGAGAWSFTPSLADGIHTLTASETDPAGNTATAALTYTLKTSAPAPVLLTLLPDTGNRVFGGTIANTTTPVIYGNGEAGDALTLFDGNTPVAATTVLANTLFLATTVPLADGVHTLTASEIDIAGNVSPLSAPLSITVPLLRLAGTGDADANGQADIVFSAKGDLTLWLSAGNALSEATVPNAQLGAEWSTFGAADFNGDHRSDVLWVNHAGQVQVWLLNGTTLSQSGIPNGQMGVAWHVAGTGDFNGDGDADIFWASTTGQATVWSMNGTSLSSVGLVDGQMGSEWHIAGTGDFNGDGRDDVIWESNTGNLTIWGMNGSHLQTLYNGVGQMGAEWHIGGVGDLNGDGTDDIVWVDSNNNVQIWTMNGGQIGQITTPAGHDGVEWRLEGVNDFAGTGTPQLLWLRNDGAADLWQLSGAQVHTSFPSPTTPMHPILGI